MTGKTRRSCGITHAYRACMQNDRAGGQSGCSSPIVIVVLCSVAQVRYFGIFRGSLDGATEYGRFAIVWTVMLGSTLALDRGAHVGIDFSAMIETRSCSVRFWNACGMVLGFVFVTVLAWQGFLLCARDDTANFSVHGSADERRSYSRDPGWGVDHGPANCILALPACLN